MKRLRPAMNLKADQHATGSDYREFPVPSQLANHVLCFWKQVIVGSGEYAHQVLPDGCVDFVFINEEPPIVVGPWTDAFIARFRAGTMVTGALAPRLRTKRSWHPRFGVAQLFDTAESSLGQEQD